MKPLFTIPLLASDGGVKRFHLFVLHDRRTHEIFPWFMFWAVQAEIPWDCSQHAGGPLWCHSICNLQQVGWEMVFLSFQRTIGTRTFQRKWTVIAIKKFQHFNFDHSIKGNVQYRTICDSQKTTVQIVKSAAWIPSSSVLPDIVEPKCCGCKRGNGIFMTRSGRFARMVKIPPVHCLHVPNLRAPTTIAQELRLRAVPSPATVQASHHLQRKGGFVVIVGN